MAMAMESAGLLMYRKQSEIEFFLVHPGGPFFKNKDVGYWSIPKGLQEAGETLLETACREFTEETGVSPQGPYVPLGTVTQKGGKKVHGWAFEKSINQSQVLPSNIFTMEWPRGSGRFQSFLEIDKSGYFVLSEALIKINSAQASFLNALTDMLSR